MSAAATARRKGSKRAPGALAVFGIVGVRGSERPRYRVFVFERGSFRGWITEPEDTELSRSANGWRWSWRILTAGSSGRSEGLLEAALALEDSVLATGERYGSIMRVIGGLRAT